MIVRSSILTYLIEEDLRFHRAKWQSLFVLVLLYKIMQINILQDIIKPPFENLLKEFWELILQNIFLLVNNTENRLKFAAKIVLQQQTKACNRMKFENKQ